MYAADRGRGRGGNYGLALGGLQMACSVAVFGTKRTPCLRGDQTGSSARRATAWFAVDGYDAQGAGWVFRVRGSPWCGLASRTEQGAGWFVFDVVSPGNRGDLNKAVRPGRVRFFLYALSSPSTTLSFVFLVCCLLLDASEGIILSAEGPRTGSYHCICILSYKTRGCVTVHCTLETEEIHLRDSTRRQNKTDLFLDSWTCCTRTRSTHSTATANPGPTSNQSKPTRRVITTQPHIKMATTFTFTTPTPIHRLRTAFSPSRSRSISPSSTGTTSPLAPRRGRTGSPDSHRSSGSIESLRNLLLLRRKHSVLDMEMEEERCLFEVEMEVLEPRPSVGDGAVGIFEVLSGRV